VNLDWKWVGLGTLIMLALSIVAGIAGRLARRTATRDLVVGVLLLLSMGRLTRKWPFSLDCQRG